ncbi:GGDEF domain-containing protein [Roseateles amylovorans]|uniref:diguanylate cyclase n=1 Tax=Roseateles amylovorans TaxID=2978473 RepID=A0ABY6B422_9BURK|nr:GGDEF domain-containing protein [Roseateles amylovorans]UXH78020.1 GGDEF domain-containing protein [Roseateles amylovorans]
MDLHPLPQQARAALLAGDADAAHAAGEEWLLLALEQADEVQQAHALLHLARCDRAMHRPGDARPRSEVAARLFQQHGDAQGEAGALSVLAHSASLAGHHEEAIEAALLGLRLAQLRGDGAALAVALRDLGACYVWARSFDKAAEVLRQAADAANACKPPQSPLSACLWLALGELLRMAGEREQRGQLPTRGALEGHLINARHLLAHGDAAQARESDHEADREQVREWECWWTLMQTLAQIWKGASALAQPELQQALALLPAQERHWLAALAGWVQTELAWSRRLWPQARRAASQLVALADEGQHEPLAQLGELIASQIEEQQGQPQRALQRMRDLREREARVRIASLASRAEAVQWQLDARRSERDRARLADEAQRLARLSMEDPLTSLDNRRSFEMQARAQLARADGAGVLSLALIDVDHFKQVNDHHSHVVGDQVLNQIARLMRQHVREQDLAARLAGDEFVLLLRGATVEIAQQACHRLAEAVRRHDWSSVSEGLSVSISIGVSQCQDGDTLETLLARSDAAMYASKRERHAAVDALQVATMTDEEGSTPD